MTMNRARFLRICSSVCLAQAAGSFLPACGSALHFAAFQREGNDLLVRRAEFAQPDQPESRRPFVLLQVAGLEFPICLYRHSDQEYSALYLRCTHQGCQLDAYATALVCPCHGSEFDTYGRVTQSPAEADLSVFEVKADEQTIYVRI